MNSGRIVAEENSGIVAVVIKNEGDVSETFDVSTYYDLVLIGVLNVECLAPRAQKDLMFSWCTSCMRPGNYT